MTGATGQHIRNMFAISSPLSQDLLAMPERIAQSTLQNLPLLISAASNGPVSLGVGPTLASVSAPSLFEAPGILVVHGIDAVLLPAANFPLGRKLLVRRRSTVLSLLHFTKFLKAFFTRNSLLYTGLGSEASLFPFL